MKEKVSQVATVFSAFVMVASPRSTDFHSSWTNWICRSISLLFTKVSVIVQHRYHHPSCILLLHGLREKRQKEEFYHRLMDHDVFVFCMFLFISS